MKTLTPALAVLLLAACAPTGTQPRLNAQERGRELADRYLIVDTHIDVPFRLYQSNGDGGGASGENGNREDISRATGGGDFDYPRAKEGGLDALFMSIYIPAEVDEAGGAKDLAEELIDGVIDLTESHPDKFALATCTTDVLNIQARGLVAMPLGMENGGPIDGDLANLDHFRERGIRYVTLAHSKSNHISDSSYDDNERWGGLSPFGERLIPAMNERGVMVDVSHISDLAFWDVMELTEVPVIASHSSLRHFTPGFQRNMDDDMVEALGENGGVVQINFGSSFLTAEANSYGDAVQAARDALLGQPGVDEDDPRLADFGDRYRAGHPYPYADLEDVLDHIDRAVQLAGVEHVGIGSDYDGVGDTLPTGLKDVSDYPNLVAGLIRRGYDDEEIAGILGGNVMRVWREVEAHAAASGYAPLCSQ